MNDWSERWAVGGNSHPCKWWFDLQGKLIGLWWRYQEHRRAKNPELVELDAFRALIALEKKQKELGLLTSEEFDQKVAALLA